METNSETQEIEVILIETSEHCTVERLLHNGKGLGWRVTFRSGYAHHLNTLTAAMCIYNGENKWQEGRK
jgi:hypothetical protein